MQKFITSLLISQGILSMGLAGSAQEKRGMPKPNVLFCIADDASFHHFSAAGCNWVNTPNFDRLAREGIFFTNCYTPNAKSAPSRACILTGRNSWQLKEAGNHISNFPAEFRSFVEAISMKGYKTGFTGKGWAPGNPGKIDGESRKLTGRSYDKHTLTPPTSEISKKDYAANFGDFLTEIKSENNQNPWFFWFGSHEPHRAYEYGSGVKIGGKKLSQIDNIPSYYPDNHSVRNDLLDYGLEIEYLDKSVGQMIEQLERHSMLENTLIIITADNGMPFPRSKANNYEQANHMPLVMYWRNGIRNPGREQSGYISFIDFAPTFLELFGIEQNDSGMAQITGHSLVDILEDNQSLEERTKRESILLGRERDDYGRPDNQGYPIRSIIRDNIMYLTNLKPSLYPAGNPETGYPDVDGGATKTSILALQRTGDTKYWEYSFGFRPAEEMYDLSKDVDCMKNLASLPEYKVLKESLRKELFDRLIEQKDPRVTGNGDLFDKYPFDSPDKHNFYENVKNGKIKEPWKQTNWLSPTDYDSYVNGVKNSTIKAVDENKFPE